MLKPKRAHRAHRFEMDPGTQGCILLARFARFAGLLGLEP